METNQHELGGIKYTVKGYGILVEIEAIPENSSTIVIPGAEQKREAYLAARHTGWVRAIGKCAFNDEVEERCKVGDKILFSSYSGRDLNRDEENRLRKDQPLLRVMVDKDVMCVIEDIKREGKDNV